MLQNVFTDWLSLVLMQDLAVAPVHISHVYCVTISPVDFSRKKQHD